MRGAGCGTDSSPPAKRDDAIDARENSSTCVASNGAAAVEDCTRVKGKSDVRERRTSESKRLASHRRANGPMATTR